MALRRERCASAEVQQMEQATKESSLIPLEHREEAIARPVFQAKAKQLMSALEPNEVLLVMIAPERPVIIWNEEEQNLVFHLDELYQDVSTALQSCYQHYPLSLQTVGVNDPSDFLDLAKKSGCGAAGKASVEAFDCYSIHDLSVFFEKIGVSPPAKLRADHPFSSLSADRIGKAFADIPKQEGKIECAANSAARALILIGVENMKETYSSFNENCPQDLKTMCENGNPVEHLFKKIPAAAQMGEACANWLNNTAVTLAATEPVQTGPSPASLTKYINDHIPSTSVYKEARVLTYKDFSECAESILEGISHSDPVMVFIFWNKTQWHYSNVVAVEKGPEKPNGFWLLETPQTFDFRPYNDLEDKMLNKNPLATFLSLGEPSPDKYNLIRFYRKDNEE